MTWPHDGFARGNLRALMTERSQQALACGALQPIATTQVMVQDGPVRFLVRMVSSLMLKELERRRRERPATSGPPVNPFLPCDPDLCVAGLSATHVALLNKFPVMADHLLIVTRHYEDQEMLLTREDFAALWLCLAEVDGLGFYNGGTAAGASQPHKHLQIVPLPFAEEGPPVPMAPLLQPMPSPAGPGHLPGLPFPHAIARLDRSQFQDPAPAGEAAHQLHLELMRAAGLPPTDAARQPGPYNLLVTRDWMLVVPRSRECWEGISVNALGFAGSLFVRDHAQLDQLRQCQPLRLLAEVSC